VVDGQYQLASFWCIVTQVWVALPRCNPTPGAKPLTRQVKAFADANQEDVAQGECITSQF
jgi:hypothetical protein